MEIKSCMSDYLLVLLFIAYLCRRSCVVNKIRHKILSTTKSDLLTGSAV